MSFNLSSLDISSVSEATELFGREKGLLSVRPGRYLRPWFAVPEGCYALITRFGKDFNHVSGSPVWPPGFYYGWPWTKVTNLVTKQSVVFNIPVKKCKTQVCAESCSSRAACLPLSPFGGALVGRTPWVAACQRTCAPAPDHRLAAAPFPLRLCTPAGQRDGADQPLGRLPYHGRREQGRGPEPCA